MTPTISLETAAVLAAARADRREAEAAETRLLQRVAQWAELHRIDHPTSTDTGGGAGSGVVATFGDTPVSLAGPGAPHVSQFAVLEFGAVLKMSRRSTELLFADVLELAHRLPLTWTQVLDGRLRPWRARPIATTTQALSPVAAAYVDSHVAPFADRVSPTELQRLVDAAIARFMPAHAEQIAAAAEQTQVLQIDADQPSYTGTCTIRGELDLPDALDLEQAVQAGAEQQADLGSALPLGARRAKALGNLARGELVLDYNSGLPETARIHDAAPPTVTKRQVVLYAHLNADGSAHLDNHGRHLVTPDQIRTWCGTAGSVVVKPILDLAEEITSPGYCPTERQAEQVALRDRWCPFPWCEHDARHADKDHVKPYDPDGPPDQTTSSNLAPPCRTHHRLKTFSDWTYTRIGPDAYLWRSPHGYVFLKDTTGTRDLTPRPVDPPGSRRSP
jgi:hypothetical protein